jgi:putative transposon-encoded protein
VHQPFVSRKLFVPDNKLSISDDEIERILERTVIKQGTSARADMPSRYLGKRVYVIITKSEGERDQEYCPTHLKTNTLI